eukprot:334378-Chlamydomonas_euryale.AAC.1
MPNIVTSVTQPLNQGGEPVCVCGGGGLEALAPGGVYHGNISAMRDHRESLCRDEVAQRVQSCLLNQQDDEEGSDEDTPVVTRNATLEVSTSKDLSVAR